MHFLKVSKVTFLLLTIFICFPAQSKPSNILCLTGRIVKSLPSYGDSFINAAELAIEQRKLKNKVIIRTYFFDNSPLEPIRIYNKMKSEGCSAIIGFEYLSDLLLVIRTQKDYHIPIFTSYPSTTSHEFLPRNIFLFMPNYNYLVQKMMVYLHDNFGNMTNILLATEVNRDEMRRYKSTYAEFLNSSQVKFDTFDFLEDDAVFDKKLRDFVKNKHYNYVFLLAGTIASAKVANLMNDHKTIFIGTENYGSSVNQSFYIRLQDKDIRSFFIRNVDFLKSTNHLKKFQLDYTKKYHISPTLLSAYTYDAANIILNAFKKTGSMDVDDIIKVNYNGITGIYLKDGQFHRSDDYVILSVKKNGFAYEE